MTQSAEEQQRETEEAPLQQTDKPTWPEGVRVISFFELENLGVDRNGALYWNGNVVTIQKSFTLTWWQKVTAAAATLSAMLIAASGITQGLVAYAQWACQVGWPSVCPMVP